ncbi:MAG: CocE/NonD family hydrolase [Candidatus Leucobacter sulfamidivorax]|nr:CocE/NonD family hydrolase [Candidatus Leucobacter sulfamidivorax]
MVGWERSLARIAKEHSTMAEAPAEPQPTRDGTILGVPDSVPVVFRKLLGVENSPYPGFSQDTTVLPRGSVHREGGMPLPADVLRERDVAVTLRDGTVIYADVFRPTGDEPVPAILVWGPYGKGGGFLANDAFPGRMDVDSSWEDGLNKFEGPNPGYWVSHGYAVVHTDSRGTWASEGDLQFFGQQDAQDEYDVIEWIADQPWAAGPVGLAGNSWLAISQWHVAALKPPHLAAIAPWEGQAETYRESSLRGGIPDTVFSSLISGGFRGPGWGEDIAAMAQRYPLINEYWESKDPDLEAIEVPAYLVASWTNIVHTQGTFAAWRRIGSKQKWLRVHNTHEWNDLFNPEYVEDLRRFFDRFMKGVDNGWEATPPVRLSVLDPGGTDIVNRAESAFPLERQRFVPFHLDAASGSLAAAPVPTAAELRYEPDAEGTTFDFAFDRDVEFTGYGKARLWMAAEDADDLDVYVTVTKVGASGEELLPYVVTDRTHAGMNGRLRASLRQLDDAASTEIEPRQTFRTVEKLEPGQIVPLEIPLWPYSIRFHAGEKLRLRVHGVDRLKRPEFPQLPPDPTLNRGRHVIYAGGEYDSHLLLSEV